MSNINKIKIKLPSIAVIAAIEKETMGDVPTRIAQNIFQLGKCAGFVF